MVTKDFNQANALINRLMEDVGGSANAYDEPLPASEPKQEAPGPGEEDDPGEEQPTTLDDSEGCLDGEAIDPDDRSWWCNPPPITDEYESAGIVEDSEELQAIWVAITESIEKGEPQEVKLETGSVWTEPQYGETWIVKDEVKDRFYCQEKAHVTYDIVNEDDAFIWVLLISDPDTDLGYIHEGYVFLRK